MSGAAKRAACDRCHGQKMRCNREAAREKCSRCLAARAECIFSNARKAGRPSATMGGSTSPQRHEQVDSSKRERGARRRESKGDTRQRDIAPYPGEPFQDIDVDDFSGDLPVSEWFSGSMAINPQIFWSESDLGPRTISGTGSSEIHFPTDTFPTPSSSIFASPFSTMENSGPLERVPQEGERELERNRAESAPITEPADDKVCGGGRLAIGNAMQQLSALNGRMFAYIQSPPQLGADDVDFANDANIEQLAAHVISSSVEFHEILRNEPFSSSFSFDTAATLLILTTYVRLAQLHHALYQRIYQSLIGLPLLTFPPSSSADNDAGTPTHPIPIAFPSLQICGVSLSAYTRFQSKFVLQICVHHLGEVEEVLGLPAGFCVNENGDGSEGGVLHRDTGGMVLVTTVMMEADETIKGIRKMLAQLREELRGSIQI